MEFLNICMKIIFVINFGKVIAETALKLKDAPLYRIPIGVVFDQNSAQTQNGFKMAILQHTQINLSDYLSFEVFVDVINTADTFKLSRLVCNQFSRGVMALLAAVNLDSFSPFQSYTKTFNMPFVTSKLHEKVIVPPFVGSPDTTISILPDYHLAIMETVSYYGWDNVIYLYDSPDGVIRLEKIYKSLIPGKKPYFKISGIKKVDTAKETIAYLKQLEEHDRWSNKYIILDCSTAIAKEIIITHVHDVQLGRRNYHYLFSGLVFDERWDRDVREYGTINMTGFKLVDTSRKFVKDFFANWKLDFIAANGALMYDAAHMVLEAFQRILKNKPHIIESLMNKNNAKYRFLNCDSEDAVPLKYGEEIIDNIRKTQIEGLTGKIRFTNDGMRKNFYVVVVRNTPKADMVKIAVWYDDKGFRPVKRLNAPVTSGKYNRNKTYIVVSIHEPPYFISSKPKKDSDNNEDNASIEYSGFCADLAELIAEKLQINIQFRLSSDEKIGNLNPKVTGGWDGMVGELIRKEADMVIAPLIVTAEREAVIDFSNPFLFFNEMDFKSKNDKKTWFGFLKPLSFDVWILLAGSVILVGIVMYIVSRFSPVEWKIVAVTDSTQSVEGNEAPVTRASIINKFSFINSVWYAVGSIMQQGSEFSPRSVSGRIVSAVWWFFALIIVCSYTAYLAARLTLSGMEVLQIPVYNKITQCPEDMQADIYKGILVHDESNGNPENLAFTPNSDNNCEMLITVLDPGVKKFAVAFPKGSKLRTEVNIALIAIRKEGLLDALLRKHFQDTAASTGGGNELSLDEFVGLFYLLLSGILVGLAVAIVEFCNYYRYGAAKPGITIKTARRGNSRVPVNEVQPTVRRINRRDLNQDEAANEPRPFNELPRVLANRPNPQRPRHIMSRERQQQIMQEYFTPATEIESQDETTLQNSFTQV